jgi:hypothetical protein
MVDNYVKLMTQECRSMIRSAAKKIGIQELMDGTTELVRDTILGVKKPDSEDRPGHLFKENGVHIYGVDVLTVDIIDTEIRRLLEAAQHETVHNTLKILQSAQKANLVEATTRDTRRIEQMVHDTTMVELEHKQEKAERLAEQAMSALEARAKASAKERELEEAALEMRKKIEGFNAEMLQTTSDIRTKSIKEQFAAITPDLIAALIAVGDKQLATTMMENLPKASGEIGTLLGIGGMPALLQTFKGTPVEKVLLNMGAKDIG